MITLEEFREEFINEIKVDALQNNQYPVENFIEKMKDILINDYSLVSDLDDCFFEGTSGNKKMHIDAAYLELSTNVLDLLVADFNSEEITNINNEFINSKSKLMINYFESVLKGYFNGAEQSNPATQLSIDIRKNLSSINKLHLIIISTNKMSKHVKTTELPDFNIGERTFKVDLDVIGIENIYNTKLPSFKKEPIVIDTSEFGCDGVQCIKADIGTDDYEAYLAIVPGKFLCDVYKKYGPRLLESNVRSFLNVRGAVNKGIRATILNERNKFFTYNNGISTIAKNIETKYVPNRGLYITKFTDFQIINGGQTTASLASADIKDKAPLSNIYVQMKLTILQEENPELIHNISKYANSQNKVTAADLNSNHPFYGLMEDFSRKIYAPPINNQPYQTLWFFERARGQYDQPKMSKTKAERASYEKTNPKSQKFTKTDLAKYLNSSYMKPYDVSWGAEVNLTRFQVELEKQWDKDKTIFNEIFYKDLIAKAILFKTIERVISNQEWYIANKAYRAQLVTYTFSKLVYEVQKNSDSELDYKYIWDKQIIPDYLIDEIQKISKLAFDVLYDENRQYANISEYCKRKECWEVLKNKAYTLSEETIESLITKEEKKQEEIIAKKEQKLNNTIMAEVQIFNLGSNYWTELLEKGSNQGFLNGKDIDLLNCAIKYCNGLITISPAQANYIWNVKEQLEKNSIK
jgi:hypothetical protein